MSKAKLIGSNGLRLAVLGGIPLYLDWTWLVWVAVIALGSLDATISLLTIFTFVTMHEYGHALTAKRLGVDVDSITLYPIGGIARIKLFAGVIDPAIEMKVTCAGPAVNAVLLLFFFPASLWYPDITWLSECVRWNSVLLFFNLLPIFPLDGGRVLRAALAFRFGPVKATRLSLGISRAGLIGLALAAIYSSAWIILILVPVLFFMGIGEMKLVEKNQERSGMCEKIRYIIAHKSGRTELEKASAIEICDALAGMKDFDWGDGITSKILSDVLAERENLENDYNPVWRMNREMMAKVERTLSVPETKVG